MFLQQQLLRPWLALLLLLLCLSNSSSVSAATAYLVNSMERTYEASNNSFNNLRGILLRLDFFDTIVLTEDYNVDAADRQDYSPGQPEYPVRLSQNLTITSEPGEMNMLSFAFLTNIVLMNNFTVTLQSIVVDAARKSSGQSVPFFTGEGLLWLEDVVRVRLACSAVINATINTLRTAPRPAGLPGVQQVYLTNFTFRGQQYPNSVQSLDTALFVSPGDIEDAAYYAGYSVMQRNVTRVCQSYVPPNCNEQCLLQVVDRILAAEAAAAHSASKHKQLVATVVPAVVVPVVVLSAAAVAAFFLIRRRSSRAAALQQEQQGSKQLSQLGGGSAHRGLSPGGYDSGSGPGGGGLGRGQQQQMVHSGRGVPAGLVGRPMDLGAVGSIEEVAIGGIDGSARKGWHLMACHTAPEFPEATAKDAITLGVLLGAGSFGRVYRGRWRGIDVAVKVLHHDVSTAASVANEVDLVMSFRHPNITTAYHFLTWNYSHEAAQTGTSGSQLTTRNSPEHESGDFGAGQAGHTAAAGSLGDHPATPSLLRQLVVSRGSGSIELVTGSSSGRQQQHAGGASSSSTGAAHGSDSRLSVIQSQSAVSNSAAGGNSSAYRRSSSGPLQQQQQQSLSDPLWSASRSGPVPASNTTAAVSRLAAAAPAAAPAALSTEQSWGSAVQPQAAAINAGSSGSSSSSEPGGRSSSSSSSGPLQPARRRSSSGSRLQLAHVTEFGPLPLLHHVQPHPPQPLPIPAAAAGQAAAAAVAGMQPRLGSLHDVGSGSSAAAVSTSPASQPLLGVAGSAAHLVPQQPPGLEAGTLSPEGPALVPDWADGSRFMPCWQVSSPGQHTSRQPTSGWSSTGVFAHGPSLSTHAQSLTGSHTDLQQQQQAEGQGQQQQQLLPALRLPGVSSATQEGSQQQLQQQQQPPPQEFVPVVPYNITVGPAGGPTGDPHQSGGSSFQQQQQQQQPLERRYVPLIHTSCEHSSNSSTTSPSAQVQSGQLRPQQFMGSRSAWLGSGSSSLGVGSRARAGEAQTWLILEYCDGGTLLDLMQEGRLRDLAHALTLLSDVAAGMNYLHQRNCVHGDLKPANVLLKRQQGAPFGHVAKVSDFGLSKSLTAGQSHRSTRTLGTFNRAPPELLRLGRLSPACDVYGFGIMVWELYTGQVAFSGAHYGEVFERVALQQERPPIPPDMPADLRALMEACWAPEPIERPAFFSIQEQLAAMLKNLPSGADRFFSDL